MVDIIQSLFGEHTIENVISSFFGTLIGSAGGILAILKFGGTKIIDAFIQSYTEKTKAQFDVKKHVTQQQFDKEFETVGKVLEYIYECAMSVQRVDHNSRSLDDQKYEEIITEFNSKVKIFAEFYFKNNLYINKDLSAKLLEVIKKLDRFQTIAEVHRDIGGKLESVVGVDREALSPAGRMEIESLEKDYKEYKEELKEIVKLLGDEGQPLSYYTLVENAKDYFYNLSILQK